LCERASFYLCISWFIFNHSEQINHTNLRTVGAIGKDAVELHVHGWAETVGIVRIVHLMQEMAAQAHVQRLRWRKIGLRHIRTLTDVFFSANGCIAAAPAAAAPAASILSWESVDIYCIFFSTVPASSRNHVNKCFIRARVCGFSPSWPWPSSPPRQLFLALQTPAEPPPKGRQRRRGSSCHTALSQWWWRQTEACRASPSSTAGTSIPPKEKRCDITAPDHRGIQQPKNRKK